MAPFSALFIYFCSFQIFLPFHNCRLNRIRTQIVKVEGEYHDQLTTNRRPERLKVFFQVIIPILWTLWRDCSSLSSA